MQINVEISFGLVVEVDFPHGVTLGGGAGAGQLAGEVLWLKHPTTGLFHSVTLAPGSGPAVVRTSQTGVVTLPPQ